MSSRYIRPYTISNYNGTTISQPQSQPLPLSQTQTQTQPLPQPQPGQAQMQLQERIMITQQMQDNIRIQDCLLRTMSTVENLTRKKNEKKNYNIDKKDALKIKSHEEIIDDFLMNISCLNSMINIFKKRHVKKIPQILPPYEKTKLIKDLKNYKVKAIKKEPFLEKYFNDFEKLINSNNCQIYSESEMFRSFKDEESIDENKINNFADQVFTQNREEQQRIQEAVNNYVETGQTGQTGGENSSDSNIDIDDDKIYPEHTG